MENVYKALLIGKNNKIIDIFFDQFWDNFDCLTSSLRFDDINSHMNMFGPDVLVFCLQNEDKDSFMRVNELKPKIERMDIPLVVIGNPDECKNFNDYTELDISKIIPEPTSAAAIRKEVEGLITGKIDRNAIVGDRLRQIEEQKPKPEQKKHVLVIDDDPLMLKMIKEQIGDEYNVGTAISGKLAYKFLEKKSTDLILLDYEMPDENGAQVLENIRTIPEKNTIPVVFLTGVTDKEKIAKVASLKPQGYLLKPIDREKLLKAIKKII